LVVLLYAECKASKTDCCHKRKGNTAIALNCPAKTIAITASVSISILSYCGQEGRRQASFMVRSWSCWSGRRRLSPSPSEMSRADDGGRSCRNGSAPTHLFHGRSAWRAELRRRLHSGNPPGREIGMALTGIGVLAGLYLPILATQFVSPEKCVAASLANTAAQA
jgi:hypothetical protein